jgi:hypothetical protein
MYVRHCPCQRRLVRQAFQRMFDAMCGFLCLQPSSESCQRRPRGPQKRITCDSAQICGGSNALSVYYQQDFVSKTVLPKGWESLGCIAEGNQGRALISAQMDSDSMTIDMCLNYCSSKGFGMAGLVSLLLLVGVSIADSLYRSMDANVSAPRILFPTEHPLQSLVTDGEPTVSYARWSATDRRNRCLHQLHAMRR